MMTSVTIKTHFKRVLEKELDKQLKGTLLSRAVNALEASRFVYVAPLISGERPGSTVNFVVSRREYDANKKDVANLVSSRLRNAEKTLLGV